MAVNGDGKNKNKRMLMSILLFLFSKRQLLIRSST